MQSFVANLRYAALGQLTEKVFAASLASTQNEYLLQNHSQFGRAWNCERMSSYIMQDILNNVKKNAMDQETDYKAIFKYANRMEKDQLDMLAKTLIEKYTPLGGAGGAVPAPVLGAGGAGEDAEMTRLKDEFRKIQAELTLASTDSAIKSDMAHQAEDDAEEARIKAEKAQKEADETRINAEKTQKKAKEARDHEKSVRAKLDMAVKAIFEHDRKRKRDQA